jgi:hypothetical protein
MQRSLDEIRSEMFDNQERKQAIMAQAERQNRDLTPEEAEEFDDLAAQFRANESK